VRFNKTKSFFQKIILEWVSVLYIAPYPNRFRVAVEFLGWKV